MNYREYWQEFARNGDFDLHKPKSGSTQYRALLPGTAKETWLYASLHGDDPRIKRSIGVGVSFTGPYAAERYEALKQRCAQEIAQLQQPVYDGDFAANGPFEDAAAGLLFCFSVRNEGFDPENTAQWRDQHNWMCRWLPKYQDVFRRCLSRK